MNLSDFLRQHNITTAPEHHHHRTRSFIIQVDCPFCSPNSHKFRLGLKRTHASCWTCGGKSIVEVLVALSGQPPSTVREVVDDLPRHDDATAPKRGRLVLPPGVGPLLPCHREYIASRGMDPDYLAAVWGVQGIGLASRLAWKLFLPVIHEGQVVSWITRSIVNEGTRYISAKPEEEALDHRSLLFGEDLARGSIVIVEGPFDAFKIGPGAVATCGTAYRREQLLRMAKFPMRVVCFDSEPEAQKRARRLAGDLSVFPGQTVLATLDAKDAASATQEEIHDLRKYL